jgi:hypothetical protein
MMSPPDPTEVLTRIGGRRTDLTFGKGTWTLNRRVSAGTTVRARVERVVLTLAWTELTTVGRTRVREVSRVVWTGLSTLVETERPADPERERIRGVAFTGNE